MLDIYRKLFISILYRCGGYGTGDRFSNYADRQNMGWYQRSDVWSDSRTYKYKEGRFRPYILFGAPVLAVLSVLAFTTIGTGTTAVIYAAVTYIGCGMAYTVVNLSYGSLSTVMTTNLTILHSLTAGV